jgi:hypothetical protein
VKIRIYKLLVVFLTFIQIPKVTDAQASVTHDWTGTTSTAWEDPSNWTPNTVPASTDLVQIGVSTFTSQPTVNNPQLCAAITFGTAKTVVLTINNTLTVSGDITQNNTNNNTKYRSEITGSGTLTCQNVTIGNSYIPANSATLAQDSIVISSLINNFNILGNVNLISNASPNGNVAYFSAFDLDANTVTITGQIASSSTNAISTAYRNNGAWGFPTRGRFNANNSNHPNTLILNNVNPISLPFSADMGVDFNNSGSTAATVIYNATANSQQVFTFNDTYVGRAGGNYYNLTFAGGTKLVDGGDLTLTGNFDNSAGAIADFVTNATNLDLIGTGTQTISGGSTVNTLYTGNPIGTVFYNLTIETTSSPVVQLLGNNNIAALGTISFTSSATLNAGAVGTANTLTILSNSIGDGSLGDLTANGTKNAVVTGSINVQRYIPGGARRYMLLSSPVANTSATTYDLNPLKANTLITGPSGSTNGFNDAPSTGNSPSVFVYDENAPLTVNANLVAGNEFKPFASLSQTVPIATGIMFYFRGNQNVTKNGGSAFSRPFPAAENTTLNFSGAVYKGTGTAIDIPLFNSPPVTYYNSGVTAQSPSAGTTAGTATSLSFKSTDATKKGLNLIGNPFASTLDLNLFYSGNGSKYQFYWQLVKNAATGPNSSSTKYVVYNAASGATPPTGASRYALSGEGFFIQASGTNQTVVFKETMKAAYPGTANMPAVFTVRSPQLASPIINAASMSTPLAATVPEPPMLRIEMVQDSVVFNTADIMFDKNAKSTFDPAEDAHYLGSSGQANILYSFSSDSLGAAVNYMPDLPQIKQIELYTEFGAYGLYSLTFPIKTGLGQNGYTIYLKDRLLNDSLDVVNNPIYSFNITTTPASYAHNRFYLSIQKVQGYNYRLLNFTAQKVSNGVQVNWQTAFEADYTRFTVQRSTDGGKTFTDIGSIQSNYSAKYNFTDTSPVTGQNIYQLVQTDPNNISALSQRVTVNYTGNKDQLTLFMVYPTVANQYIQVDLGKVYSNNINVMVTNSVGMIMQNFIVSSIQRTQQDVSNLPPGVYIVNAIDKSTGKKIGYGKFLKL